MVVRIQTEDFDVSQELEALRRANPRIGALACFVGLVRDVNEDESVSAMTLEHYPRMTERAIASIVEEAQGRWDIVDVSVVHRVGRLHPTDQIVLVGVAGAHRGHAFAACEFIMDYLKTRAPFWKKEETSSGSRWVEARRGDENAAARWKR